MPSFLMIQWGIIGFFVFIHFIIGFLRGTSKSTYFTIVSLILTVVTLWLVSMLSLSMLLTSGTMLESLIQSINGFTGGAIPDDVVTYLKEPEVLALVIAIGDLVVRIVAFFILYPIMKFSLTLTIFRPIWKHGVLPQILKKQNEKALIKHEEKQGSLKRFVPRKRLKKNIFSRLFGGAVGSLRGLVVAFVFLVPLLVIAGFAAEVNTSMNVNQTNEYQNLSTSDQVAAQVPNEIQDILDNISDMHQNGLGNIVKDIKIQEKSLDRYIFDTVFTTHITIDGEKTPINYGNELEQLIGVAQVVLEGGYINNDFEIENISSDDLPNLEKVFYHIGQSDLITFMIPAAVKYGVNNLDVLLPEYFADMDLYERAASKAAIDNFLEISWDDEFMRIYDIADAALTFASVGEWMTYADQMELLAELTPEEGVLLANILRAFGELEVLTLINVALDYATTLEEVQQELIWLDAEDVEPYLQDRFAFILDDPDFFIGDEGEISRIAQIIETIFSDEFGEANLSILINSMNDPEALINNQNPDWVGAIIEDLVQVKLIIETLPVGVDYAFYTQLKTSMDETLADQIAAELEQVEWDTEIINVGDIYKEALKLGVGAVFGDNPDYYQFIDDVAVNHMDSLRLIVEYIFEGSEVVNTAIELASPYIVETYVEDEALKDVILEILMTDPSSEVVDFNFGREVNNILTIVESIYKFSTTSELVALPTMNTNELLETISQFGTLTESDYLELRTAVDSLQLLKRAGVSGMNYVQTLIDTPYLYVPDVVELNRDFTVIIDIAYEVANYLQNQSALVTDYQEIDFTALLASDEFRAYFLSTPEEKHSNLIFSNIIHNINYLSAEGALSEYLSLPTVLLEANINDSIWETEVNNLLSSIFDLATTIGQTPNIELSLNRVLEIANDPTNLSIEVFTQFSDELKAIDAFGSLDSSMVLRHSLVTIINNLGEQNQTGLYGYQISVPEHLLSDEMLVSGTIPNLIYAIATLVDDMNNHMNFETISDAINYPTPIDYIDAFNQVSDTTLNVFGSADLIHGIISDVLLNPDMQQVGRDLINNMQPMGITVGQDFLALTRSNDVLDTYEFSELLIGIKALQLTPELVGDFNNQMFSYVQSLTDTRLDQFFEPYLLRELIDQVISNDDILDGLVGLVEAQYEQVQLTQAMLAGVNPNIDAIIRSLSNVKDDDNFFDTKEFKAWILAFKELEIESMEDLNSLGNLQNIHEKVATTFVIETLLESKWLYGLIDDVFTKQSTLEQIAQLASDQANKYAGVSHQFSIDEVSFVAEKYGIVETTGENAGHVKVSEIKNFILAGTRLNWPSLGLGTGTQLVSNLANELFNTGFDGQRHIDVIFNSKVLVGILDKTMNFEHNTYRLDEIVINVINDRLSTIAALDGLQLTTDILHYDLRAYDENNVIRKEEFIQMFEAVTYINFDEPIQINTFYQMTVDGTFDQLFDSKIIHSFVSNALTSEVVQQFGVDKANQAQSVVTLSSDILAVDPLLMDGDLFKVSELENILVAMHTLGLTDSSGFSSIGIPTFTNLLGSNIDPITGEDDFDRVFSANYIYVLLDRILKLESLGDYVGEMLGNALGVAMDSLDTTPSNAMLADGNAPYEPIEDGRVPKDEFRSMINSLSLLGDIGAISLNTFTDMVEPNQPTDDFTTFIASDYIYTILARLFDHPAFGDYVGDMLAGAFADDPINLEMSTPSDAKGVTGVEEDLMTRFELRQLMISFDMLGLDDDQEVSVTTIMNMIDSNIDPITGEDDFSRFITSLYIQDKVSQLLLSEQVIDIIANDRFTAAEFIMPPSSLVEVDGRDRMIKQEIYDLFYGLKLLGLTDFDNVDITLDDVTNLTDQEEDQLLTSSYLYVTLDLMLKSETSINIPDDALEVSGNFDGMIKKSEIKDLLQVFDILGESNPEDIDVNTITIADIRDMLDLNSSIIDQMISDAIVDNLTTVPLTAYNAEGTRVSRIELYKMIDTLLILSDDDDTQKLNSLMPIDANTLDNQKLRDIHDVDSRIVDRLTSEAIIDSGINIHSLAYDENSEVDETNQKLDIKREELSAMLEALDLLDIDISDTSAIDQSKYTPTNIGLLLDLESLMVYRLISESIIDQGLQTDESLAEDGIDDNYDPEAPGSDIKVHEMEALVEAMTVLGIVDLSQTIEVDTVSIAQLEQTHWLGLGIDPNGDVYESRIIHRLISDSVISTVDVPDDAYMTIDQKDVIPVEITALIKALDVMGLNTLGDPIDVNDLTVLTLKELHYLGLGTDPINDEYDSLIIHRMVSDAVVDSLYSGDPLNAPSGVFKTIANEDLEEDEISALIAAMEEMNIDKLGNSLSINDPSKDQLQNLHYIGLAEDPVDDMYDSLIVHRLISDTIISALDVPNDAYMTIANEDIKVDEISALIEAMDVMGITQLTAGLTFNDPTVAQIQALHDLGLNEPVGNVYDSYIVHRLLSNAIDTALDVPTEAYMVGSTVDIKPTEISHIILSMNTLGVTNVSDIVTKLTPTKLKQLYNDNPTSIDILVEPPSGPNVIIYYMTSDVIDPSNNSYDTIDPMNADDYYVMDGATRVRLLRTSIADAINALP